MKTFVHTLVSLAVVSLIVSVCIAISSPSETAEDRTPAKTYQQALKEINKRYVDCDDAIKQYPTDASLYLPDKCYLEVDAFVMYHKQVAEAYAVYLKAIGFELE